VKLWLPDDPNDPNVSEPGLWELGGVIPVNDSALTIGDFGVIATDTIFQFDDITLNNPAPIL
jgi:hypothetical protein